MFRTIWDWLEIEETRDRNLIRKAYACQMKKYHPEDAPEEAEQLRAAYKKALALASGGGAVPGQDVDGGYGAFSQQGQGIVSSRTGKTSGHEEGGFRYGHVAQEEKAPPEKERTGGQDYRYGHVAQEEMKAPPESENPGGEDYNYRHVAWKEGNVPPEREKSDGKDYHYRHVAQEEGKAPPEAPIRFEYYRFEEDRAQRLKQLEECLNEIYHKTGHGDYSQWAGAIRKCLTVEDLKNTHVVAAAISLLAQMRGMDDHVWDALEKELFIFYGKSAEWTWLKSRFTEMRREQGDSVLAWERAKQNVIVAGRIDPRTGQMIPEKPVPRISSRAKDVIVAIVILDFLAMLILAYYFS